MRIHARECEVAIQHDDDIVGFRRQAAGKIAAGGDVDGLPDFVEAHLVPCRQGLNAGDAGNDFERKVQRSSPGEPLEDPQGAVVERRVAPDQERSAFAVRERLADRPLVLLEAQLVPGEDRGLVVWRIPIALRILDHDGAIGAIAQVALTDLEPQPRQIVFGGSLVDDEDHIDSRQRFDRLQRQMVRIAAADADDQHLAHAFEPLCRWRGWVRDILPVPGPTTP